MELYLFRRRSKVSQVEEQLFVDLRTMMLPAARATIAWISATISFLTRSLYFWYVLYGANEVTT